ncbi:MAG TPA: hypothetical protein VKS82_21055 [Streptosporangiaceae bacterium]|nr:hypothetical protein [Streptosporangiaceae bacterium]
MTFFTMRLVMFCAELGAVEVVAVMSSRVAVMSSRVAVPTGSLAEVPAIDQVPAQVFTCTASELAWGL